MARVRGKNVILELMDAVAKLETPASRFRVLLVKAWRSRANFGVTFRGLPKFEVEQIATSAEALVGRSVVTARDKKV